jgi:hypothetical protein
MQLEPARRFTLHICFKHARSTVFDLYLYYRSIPCTLHASATAGSGSLPPPRGLLWGLKSLNSISQGFVRG